MVERYRPHAALASSPTPSPISSFSTKFSRLAAPTDINAYFDKVQFWLRQPLDRESRAWLRSQCRRPRGCYFERGPARFDARLRERVEVRGISPDGLAWLPLQENLLINRIEVTVDYSFETLRGRDEAFEFFHRHLVRRHHSGKQEIRCYRDKDGKPWRVYDIREAETRYDSARRAPHSLMMYKEESSRSTGEIAPVLHLEWKANGLRATRSIGIHSAANLRDFAHRDFWADRLLLRSVSAQRLGRLYRNLRNGTKSRVSTLDDGRYGEILLRSGETIQQVLDLHGKRYPIRRVLEKIPNDVWLPGPPTFPL